MGIGREKCNSSCYIEWPFSGLLLSANKNIVLAYQDYQLKNVNPIRTSFEMPQNSLDCFTFKNINCMF